jgi:hypothetical protein
MDRPDKNGAKLYTLTLDTLRATGHPVKAPGCEWITAESVFRCLALGHLEDARQPQTKASHHAARIAWLIKHLAWGHKLDPLHIHVRRDTAYFFDGSHRLRALQLLGQKQFRAVVTGHVELLFKGNKCV